MMQDDYSSMPTRQLLDAKPVQDPYFCLWAGLMDMAATRVKSLLRFAREWNDIRFAPDYAVRRHRAVFHLNWVMSDEPSQRFTFRSLCQFAQAEDLQNAETARQRIQDAFSREAWESLQQPVDERIMKQVMIQWVSSGPKVHAADRRGARPKIEDESVGEPVESAVVAGDEWDLGD